MVGGQNPTSSCLGKDMELFLICSELAKRVVKLCRLNWVVCWFW